jgi:hypothetical protein
VGNLLVELVEIEHQKLLKKITYCIFNSWLGTVLMIVSASLRRVLGGQKDSAISGTNGDQNGYQIFSFVTPGCPISPSRSAAIFPQSGTALQMPWPPER